MLSWLKLWHHHNSHMVESKKLLRWIRTSEQGRAEDEMESVVYLVFYLIYFLLFKVFFYIFFLLKKKWISCGYHRSRIIGNYRSLLIMSFQNSGSSEIIQFISILYVGFTLKYRIKLLGIESTTLTNRYDGSSVFITCSTLLDVLFLTSYQ